MSTISQVERGATAIQYGLIAALVAIAMAAALPTLGSKLSSTLCTAAAGLGNGGCGASSPSSFTTMAACKGAGNAWDGLYCDSVASANAKALVACNAANANWYSGNATCSGTSMTISNYSPDGNSITQASCQGFSGTWSATGGLMSAGTCTLTGAAMTATALICLDATGIGMNPDGSCSATAATANTTLINDNFGDAATANNAMYAGGTSLFGAGTTTTTNGIYGTVIKAP